MTGAIAIGRDEKTAPALGRTHAVMGTMVSFDVRPGKAETNAALVALSRACARLERADAVFSTFKPDSPMSRLRREEITFSEAPVEMGEVLELCALARDLSEGWFDPWRMPGGFDPTGLVKGWAAGRALDELRAIAVAGAMVSAGGDLATSGGPSAGQSWRIGVRDPSALDRVACVIESPGAVATSGCYERGEHVIDPRTGRPGTGCKSATVTGPELWLADALATGLLVAGPDGLAWIEAIDGYEGYVIEQTGGATSTSSFPFAP